jgi:DNA-binding LacI/PurR family transcriptional regulator
LGYNLMICNSDEDPVMEEQYIREFQMRQVDGIVINPTVRNQGLYQKLIEEKYPLVLINRKIPGWSSHNVVMDNVKGASMAIKHLLNNGRTKVAVFTYRNPYVSTWKERVEGYRTAMLESGFSLEDLRIHELDQQPGAIKEMTMSYLREHPDTDAIFSTNNMMTLEVIEGIKGLNLTIPDDIALVGYDETVWSKHLNPPLTTIMQPGYEMGQLSAQMLIKTVKAEQLGHSGTVVLEPKLIVRSSSGSVINSKY